MPYPFVHTGAFTVCYGKDADSGKTLILLFERGHVFKGTHGEGYGGPGGFIELDDKEQPRDGAVREMHEELLMPDGSSVLGDVKGDRLKIVDTGIDYTDPSKTGRAGVVWHGYTCELTNEEIKTLKTFEGRMDMDADFADAVRSRSNHEIHNILLVTPDDLLKSNLKFAYAHEKSIAERVARGLKTDISPKPNRSGFSF